MTYNCNKHGEQTEFTVGDKNYCPKCLQDIFDPRVAGEVQPEE